MPGQELIYGHCFIWDQEIAANLEFDIRIVAFIKSRLEKMGVHDSCLLTPVLHSNRIKVDFKTL